MTEYEQVSTEDSKRLNKVILIAVILALVICVGVYLLMRMEEKNKSDTGSGFDAVLMCEGWVKEQLKAPSTAEFPATLEAKTTKLSGTSWRVVSYVDAQNSFGVMIRTYYTCETTYLGSEKWRLTKMEFE